MVLREKTGMVDVIFKGFLSGAQWERDFVKTFSENKVDSFEKLSTRTRRIKDKRVINHLRTRGYSCRCCFLTL